ncbi:prevent-host-death protein [Candidatus Termititenax persephonae]|uniref:Antitoxin n=1 Tax=Candidatus Termititenax persephonae TaxID=2218525 RepID=A0A388TGY0_9BACT|nr:prevent-host-death protein [Candidatus Termititenax persephonae]
MPSIGAFAAKTHFSQILEDVAAGQGYIITRRGKPVAKIVPLPDQAVSRQEAVKQLFVLARSRIKRRGNYTIDHLLTDLRKGRR